MKIAFYLGSFNPFHNGHLKVVETAFERDNMDKVVIVPTMQSPWKYNKILDFYKRASIIALSIQSLIRSKHYNISIDFLERELEAPYFSYKTLDNLKPLYNMDGTNELYFLCGKDTMDDIPDWAEGSRIISEWKFLIVDRPEGSISSTQIRDMVKVCKDISPYVSKNTLKLINRFYYYDI